VKLLLDVHVPAAVVAALVRRDPSPDVVHLRDWRGGACLGADDREILAIAAGEARTLLTYDLRTIPVLLRALAEANDDHAGVIFADDRSIPSDDVGAIAAALRALCREQGDEDWTNRALFLRPAPHGPRGRSK
jgi:hypothetical protein